MSNESAHRRKYRRERSEGRTANRVSQPGENKFTRKEHLHLKSGGLEGWHANETEEQRHAALRRALRAPGGSYRRVIERLTIIGNLNENQSPETTRKVREDVAWVQKTFGPAEREY